jgi:hypothetical protein
VRHVSFFISAVEQNQMDMKRTTENSSNVQERTSMKDKTSNRNAQKSGRPNPSQNTINPNHRLNQDEQKKRTNQDEENEVTNAHEESSSKQDKSKKSDQSKNRSDKNDQTN